MEFKREIQSRLEEWRRSSRRKPLVLRGARQVGKTTVVNQFGRTFDNYIYLNLEDAEAAALFDLNVPLADLIPFFFAHCKKKKVEGTTLIFIDEIQNSAKAVARLRYFYEQLPEIFVIAAGSLLENLVDVKTSFPVGRVQYMALRPCSFREFLVAVGEGQLLPALADKVMSQAFHERLMLLFNQYVVTGGMPEVVQAFAETRDFASLGDVYETLLQGYRDDSEKYARGGKVSEVLRSRDIMDAWRGMIAEQVVGQELLTQNDKVSQKRNFWSRGKGESSAEVDFIWVCNSKIYPIEVKAGHNAHLRSLHSFMERSSNDVAVRVWSQPYSEDEVVTASGKAFKLINLPFYMVGGLESLVVGK